MDMRRAVSILSVSLALAACSADGDRVRPSPQPSGPIRFRVLEEMQNDAYCVEGPDAIVAPTEDAWISIVDLQTGCRARRDVQLPAVDFAEEIAVAVWWRVERCLGFDVETASVERRGDSVVVVATSSGPGKGAPCRRPGGLESFMALARGGPLSGAEAVRFVLDGREVARAPIPTG